MRHDQLTNGARIRDNNSSATRWGGVPLRPCGISNKDESPLPIPPPHQGDLSEPEDEIVRRAMRRCGLALARLVVAVAKESKP